MPLDKQLQQLSSDAPVVDASASLPGVVRRGQRRALAHRVSASVAGLMVLSGAAVAMPSIMTPDTPQPEVLHEGTDGPVKTESAETKGDPNTLKILADDYPERKDTKPAANEEETKQQEQEPAAEPKPEPKPVTKPEPEPEPKPEPKPDVGEHAYTANQVDDQVEGDPPTNVYWGTAVPGHKVTIWSNFQEDWRELGTAKANDDGEWEIQVSFGHLPTGTVDLQVKARNITTNEPVYFELQATNHGGEEQVAFTANQQYETCSEEVAYDVFFGTATAGDEIKIWSEYLAEYVYVTTNENGEWEKQVFFPDAPRDVTFDVHVKHVPTGTVTTLQFTATSDGGGQK